MFTALTSLGQDKAPKQVIIETKFLVIARGGITVPLGDFSDSHSFGINFGFSANFKVADNFYPGISIEDHLLFGKKIPGLDEHFKTFNMLRILAAPRITTNANIAFTPEVGISLNSYSGDSETAFTYGIKVDFPVMSKLPLFAGIFRTKDNTFVSAGLMIFITPKIIKQE